MGYAVVKNGIVENIVASNSEFAAQQGWIECLGPAGIGWSYDGKNFTPPLITDDEKKTNNKTRAEQLLADTNWIDTPSASNTEVKPYLSNIAEFFSYRNQLRAIIANPPVEVTWPTLPVAEWQS